MNNISKIIVFSTVLCSLIVLQGCGNGSAAHTPALGQNDRAVRPSYTDQTSRILAEHTLSQLGQQNEDYRLGPEDVIEVNIFEWELTEKTKTVPVRISQRGIVSLPMIGDLQAAGKTVWELKKQIEQRLQDGGYIRRPQVSIIIKEYHSKKIAVVGAVKEPGVYTIERNVTTLLDILSLAGGLGEHAGQMLYVVRREQARETIGDAEDSGVGPVEPVTITVDLYELMEQCDLSLNLVLQRGDIVSVPRAQQFFVYGFVKKQGGFDLNKPTTVLEGVAMAEGVDHELGSAEYCVLKRRQRGEEDKFIDLNLEAIRKGEAANIYLQANDMIDVRQTFGKKLGVAIDKMFGGIGMGLGYSINN